MRITVHVPNIDALPAVIDKLSDQQADDIEIIVAQPTAPKPAERQARKAAA